MKEKTGTVFSIAQDNIPVPGCTISKEVYCGRNAVTYFSMAEGTDISAEFYPYYKLLLPAAGSIELYGDAGFHSMANSGDGILIPPDTMMGIRTESGAIYTEVLIQKEDAMNKAIQENKAFRLADLIPYEKDKIVNMDIVHNDKMKFVIMAFDAGTGLSEHAAPGEALVFALDGEAVIGYEGKDNPIKAGENFHFAKGGLHSVKADAPFKMALLLTLET